MKLRQGYKLQCRSCCTVCGWKALREEDLHGENQNHRNSISRSGGDDPTFRESLRRRAYRLSAQTRLPLTFHPTHTHEHTHTHVHVHIILWYLRRVNHFLRPWAVGPAWAKIVLERSNHISVSVYLYLSLCLPVYLSSSSLKPSSLDSHFCVQYNDQSFTFNVFSSRKRQKLQPKDNNSRWIRKATDRESNDPARLNVPLYSCTVLSSFSLSLSSSPKWPPPLMLWILMQAVWAWWEMSIGENWRACLWRLRPVLCRAHCLHCPQEAQHDSAEQHPATRAKVTDRQELNDFALGRGSKC